MKETLFDSGTNSRRKQHESSVFLEVDIGSENSKEKTITMSSLSD